MADGFKKRAFDYFSSLKDENGQPIYAPHQAAALAAHADQESGGDTRAVHDKGTGLGVFGWRDPTPGSGRKTDLINFAKNNNLDINDETTQLKFSQHELTGSEKAAGDKLRAAPDYQSAINAGMAYLRPQGYTPNNPQAGHNYVGRYNSGAELAGVQPISAPLGSNYAPGGSGPPPTAGLLAAPSPVVPWNNPDIEARTRYSDAEINSWGHSNDAAESKANDKMAAAGAAGTQAGMSLLASAETPAVKQNLQASVYRPQGDAQGTGMPDFAQQLAQQRLLRQKRQLGGF